MGGEHGGSQGLFHSVYLNIPLQAPLAHINPIKTCFKPIFGRRKTQKVKRPIQDISPILSSLYLLHSDVITNDGAINIT